jgi:hypothetical protein
MEMEGSGACSKDKSAARVSHLVLNFIAADKQSLIRESDSIDNGPPVEGAIKGRALVHDESSLTESFFDRAQVTDDFSIGQESER